MPDFENYFSTVAQVSGGLLGLVFVALTFNPKTLGMHHDPGMRSLAEQVLADFLLVMVAALVLLLAPHITAANAGTTVAFLSLVGLIRIGRSAFTLFRGSRALRLRLLHRFWLSLMGNIGFLVAGILLYEGTHLSAAWSLMVSCPVILLLGGARSAWLLVVQNAE